MRESERERERESLHSTSGLLAVFLKECIEGSCGTTWSNFIPYTMVAGAVFFAVANVPFLTRGMRHYEALFMITVFQGRIALNTLRCK